MSHRDDADSGGVDGGARDHISGKRTKRGGIGDAAVAEANKANIATLIRRTDTFLGGSTEEH
eukprot:5125081-Pyramimonas_sp.AAC.1